MRNSFGVTPAALFVGAAFVGLGAALFSALGINGVSGGERNGVAYVNGEAIPQSEYARALSAMQAGLERPLSAEDKDRALRILIDEELIVQEAMRLGLPQSDRLVRKNLVEAMIRAPGTLSKTAQPTDKDLRSFFEQNRGMFSEARIVTVEAVRASDDASAAAFMSALQSGVSFEAARASANLERVPVPAELPMAKTGDYLGGGARDAIAAMKTADIAGPIITDGGVLFLWMIKSSGSVRSFETAKDDVRREMERREDEAAFAAYIARLRKNARINIVLEPKDSE
ncbi:peptidylprolyl isomerase [Hyphococcus sp.]|uniref:peptidylprolyl isomerase n=1 Tax=Hyphococcus sp. TaxID=2038636 RepID=UPI00208C3E62|nr:MAG: hypothetical protein DHS20C04_18050 [Marinicaulis sp.]